MFGALISQADFGKFQGKGRNKDKFAGQTEPVGNRFWHRSEAGLPPEFYRGEKNLSHCFS